MNDIAAGKQTALAAMWPPVQGGARAAMRRGIVAAVALCGALAVAPRPTWADGTSSKGQVDTEVRVFRPYTKPPQFVMPNSPKADDSSVATDIKLDVEHIGDPWQAELSGVARIGWLDSVRNAIFPRDAFVGYRRGPLRVRVGTQVLNWTALEAFHPADIMNSRNFDSELENFEKIGEPMLEVRFAIGNGYLTGYYMPFRIPPQLPDPKSRLNYAGQAFADPIWINADGTYSKDYFQNQWAVHLTQTIGSADLGLYVVQHDDREQPLVINYVDGGANPNPVYDYVTQAGLTYVQVAGSFVFKFEGAYRKFVKPAADNPVTVSPQKDHAQVAGGIEYEWTSSGGGTSILFTEAEAFLFVNELAREELSIFNPFQRDVLLGFRHSFNDIKDRQLQMYGIMDLDHTTSAFVGAIKYQQRLTDLWSVNADLRSIRQPSLDTGAQPTAPESIDEADITLSRHF